MLRRQAGVSRRGRRGSLLVMALWIVPLCLFSLSLASDYATAIAVTRQATLTAESMANAGATAFTIDPSTTSAQLDRQEAYRRASALFPIAVRAGMLRASSVQGSPTITTTSTSVTVAVPVETRMTIATVLVSFLSPGSPPITVNTVGRAQTDLCVPGVDADCAYPTDDI